MVKLGASCLCPSLLIVEYLFIVNLKRPKQRPSPQSTYWEAVAVKSCFAMCQSNFSVISLSGSQTPQGVDISSLRRFIAVWIEYLDERSVSSRNGVLSDYSSIEANVFFLGVLST